MGIIIFFFVRSFIRFIQEKLMFHKYGCIFLAPKIKSAFHPSIISIHEILPRWRIHGLLWRKADIQLFVSEYHFWLSSGIRCEKSNFDFCQHASNCFGPGVSNPLGGKADALHPFSMVPTAGFDFRQHASNCIGTGFPLRLWASKLYAMAYTRE